VRSFEDSRIFAGTRLGPAATDAREHARKRLARRER
jgi:hypothetical protein